ncbi:MAG: hypothetical protein H6607_00290 [Flavobacteriales bacterium]|nr:hypothetical protein [Flavobacteriales bacterium]
MKKELSLIYSFTFIFLTTLFVGCSDNDVVEPVSNHLVIDTTESYVKVVAIGGATSNLITHYKVDLNGDLMDDILLQYNSVASAGGINQSTLIIETINDNTTVDVETKTDSMVRYSRKYFVPELGDSIPVLYTENYVYGKQYPDNFMFIIDQNTYPVKHLYGDTLNAQSHWKTGSFVLEFCDYTNNQSYNNLVRLGNWADTEKKYIGVKYTESSINYFGWIELSVKNCRFVASKYALNK